MSAVAAVWRWIRERLFPAPPKWPAAVAAAVLGSAAAVVGAVSAASWLRLNLALAGIGLAVLAAATRWVWVSGLVVLCVVVGPASVTSEPSSGLVAGLAALTTAFVFAAHWPGSATLRGWALPAAVVALPAGGLLAAAADFANRGTWLFVGGLILVGVALGVALAPVIGPADDTPRRMP
jgi:hypothetical protein